MSTNLETGRENFFTQRLARHIDNVYRQLAAMIFASLEDRAVTTLPLGASLSSPK